MNRFKIFSLRIDKQIVFVFLTFCKKTKCTYFHVHSALGDDFTLLSRYNVDVAKTK